MSFKNLLKISFFTLLTFFLLNCKEEPKVDLDTENQTVQSEIITDSNEKYNGDFITTVETESTSSGMASITYKFSILNSVVTLDQTTVHEPLNCLGTYKAIEKNDILELFYKGEEEYCKMDEPNFKLKKEGDKFFMQGLGGEAIYNEWIEVKKQL